MKEKDIRFSEEARRELQTMKSVCMEVISLLEQESIQKEEWLGRVSELEQSIDDLTEEYREKQLERMKSGACSDEACIIFSELLTDFERIGDHALNIAQERASISVESASH